jgi:CrcB protein
MAYLLVFLGAGIGGAMRHAVNLLAHRFFGSAFPFGTLVVNVLGSFAIGGLAAWWHLRSGGDQHLRLFMTTGVLGGFTTFSAFSLDAVLLVQRQAYAQAAVYVTASILLSVAAVFVALNIFGGSAQLP